ncbi:hypothetical protein GWK47_008686 [Chionoecetes opilio]|uniref:Uncharacterized protein n=1 Tax=Chionoecetes opilio TaxID=41210 RepID=A0A8J4Y8K9_CHIOP|nr:hypothetical protein GWK47_008686 [Chionoecetes opilio]
MIWEKIGSTALPMLHSSRLRHNFLLSLAKGRTRRKRNSIGSLGMPTEMTEAFNNIHDITLHDCDTQDNGEHSPNAKKKPFAALNCARGLPSWIWTTTSIMRGKPPTARQVSLRIPSQPFGDRRHKYKRVSDWHLTVSRNMQHNAVHFEYAALVNLSGRYIPSCSR